MARNAAAVSRTRSTGTCSSLSPQPRKTGVPARLPSSSAEATDEPSRPRSARRPHRSAAGSAPRTRWRGRRPARTRTAPLARSARPTSRRRRTPCQLPRAPTRRGARCATAGRTRRGEPPTTLCLRRDERHAVAVERLREIDDSLRRRATPVESHDDGLRDRCRRACRDDRLVGMGVRGSASLVRLLSHWRPPPAVRGAATGSRSARGPPRTGRGARVTRPVR